MLYHSTFLSGPIEETLQSTFLASFVGIYASSSWVNPHFKSILEVKSERIMSDSNPSPPSEAPSASPPTGETVEEHPAVLEAPVEVVSTRIHYQAPPPPYSAVKNAPTEEANLLTNSITITIKCPSCLGFLADREMKTIVPVAVLVSRGESYMHDRDFGLKFVPQFRWRRLRRAKFLACVIRNRPYI